MSFTARQAPQAPVVPLVLVLLLAFVASLVPPWPARGEEGGPDHLVISEVVTGGSTASDEFIELYNPTTGALPLEGLELVYVSASGATISRRAAWAVGSPVVPAGHHVLVANELGAYAPIADATFATGMAASGGSAALRIQGASSAIDAVGWGTAASSWTEGTVAVAPPAGSSLERLPGGPEGSGTDTDDNASDFALREVPGPQNLGSAPTPDPDATPTPASSATLSTPPSIPPTPTPSATATASFATPGVTPDSTATVTVAGARAVPDGTEATVEATAITPSDFTDGGGYVTDATGGVAVIVEGGAFVRGERLRLTGTVSDRFAQRTLRVAADRIVRLGSGGEPAAAGAATGSIGEAAEGRLVRISGQVLGAPAQLTAGLAYDVDDGSGPIRVLVATATGIDTGGWHRGATITLVGVVGQRDSSGTGSLGYRVQPRDRADVEHVAPPPSADPTAVGSPSGLPQPTASSTSGAHGVISIAEARRAPKNAKVRVRGVVTLPTGIVDDETAVIQDGSGAIVLRVGDEVGELARGRELQVDGTRSTKGGMETLRVTVPPLRVGSGEEPTVRSVASGAVGEAHEATLVTVRGGLTASARTSSTGTVTFEVDDGSGPLRVAIGSAIGYDDSALLAGTWVEVRGVVGQETTGAQPSRGYRVWPRDRTDVRVLAAPTAGGAVGGQGHDGGTGARGGGASGTGLEGVTDGPLAVGLRIGATLVAGPWPEIGVGGLLWDGSQVVALEEGASTRVAALLGSAQPPVPVELSDVRTTGARVGGVPVARLDDAGDGIARGGGTTHPPATALPGPSDPPRWVAMVGRLVGGGEGLRLVAASGATVGIQLACDGEARPRGGVVGVIGLATPDRAGTVVVGCAGFTPAPALERGMPAVPAAARHADADQASPGTSAAPEPPRSLAAALVAMGATALVAGAVVARRADGPPPEDEPDEAAGVEPPADTSSPPSLTLVALPRERGP